MPITTSSGAPVFPGGLDSDFQTRRFRDVTVAKPRSCGYCINVKRLIALLIFDIGRAVAASARAAGPDDQYIIIYSLMQQRIHWTARSAAAGAGPIRPGAGELQKFQKFTRLEPRIVGFR